MEDLENLPRISMAWLGPEPQHKTRDTVFCVKSRKGRGEVFETKIRSTPVDYIILDNIPCLAFRFKYEIHNMYDFSSEFQSPWECPSKYVFSTKQEADAAAKFWSVKTKKWLAMIGNRNIEEGKVNIHDDCELLSCCGRISSIRDELQIIRQNEGVMECDRQTLQKHLTDCGCLPQKEFAPHLYNLFDKLDLHVVYIDSKE
jgi:hypothetical protein